MLTKEERVETARKMRAEGHTCAQCVIEAFPELTGDDPVLSVAAEGFGSGVGALQLMCGALSGAVMTMSLAPHQSRPKLYGAIRGVCRRFEEQEGSMMCGELKKPGRKPCVELIADTVGMVHESLYPDPV